MSTMHVRDEVKSPAAAAAVWLAAAAAAVAADVAVPLKAALAVQCTITLI